MGPSRPDCAHTREALPELALGIADYAYVLQTGRIALEGKASDLQRNEQVREIYLGLTAALPG